MLVGVLYFSETENPIKVNDWGKISPSNVPAKIATLHQVDINQVKSINTNDFFEKLSKSADPRDEVMVQNAQKIANFYQLIKENLRDIQVYRAEGSSRIPVIIVGFTTDGACIAFETLAVET